MFYTCLTLISGNHKVKTIEELTLLAAKAYGLDDAIYFNSVKMVYSEKLEIKTRLGNFDPLNSDLLSAQLRDKLWITVEYYPKMVTCRNALHHGGTYFSEGHDGSEEGTNAAVRLATLKCAAILGE